MHHHSGQTELARCVAVAVGLLAMNAVRADDGGFVLGNEIEQRFAPDGAGSRDEMQRLELSFPFSHRIAGSGIFVCPPVDEPRARRRLDDDAPAPEPTLVEELIADGFPTGVRRVVVEGVPPANHFVSYAPLAPERDPRYVSGSRLVAIDGVAMRFRDEVSFTFGGLTFSR